MTLARPVAAAARASAPRRAARPALPPLRKAKCVLCFRRCGEERAVWIWRGGNFTGQSLAARAAHWRRHPPPSCCLVISSDLVGVGRGVVGPKAGRRAPGVILRDASVAGERGREGRCERNTRPQCTPLPVAHYAPRSSLIVGGAIFHAIGGCGSGLGAVPRRPALPCFGEQERWGSRSGGSLFACEEESVRAPGPRAPFLPRRPAPRSSEAALLPLATGRADDWPFSSGGRAGSGVPTRPGGAPGKKEPRA
jgi:hypothetical protein